MPLKRIFFGMGFSFLSLVGIVRAPLAKEEVKVAYAFQKAGKIECLVAMNLDSLGLLKWDSTKTGAESDTTGEKVRGFADAVNKRAFTASQKDTAQILVSLTHRWKGLQRFACEKDDGYGFSVWTDSLALHCQNCFSCTEGMNIQDARGLAKLGKLTLWLYKLSEATPNR